MKRIILGFIIVILPCLTLFSQDAIDAIEKEKKLVDLIINKIGGKMIFIQDDEFNDFNSSTSKVVEGEKKLTEPMAFKKTYPLDENNDGKKEMELIYDIVISQKDDKNINTKIIMTCNVKEYDLSDDETNSIINLKDSSISLSVNGDFDTTEKIWSQIESEIKGKLNYSGALNGKSEINLSLKEEKAYSLSNSYKGKIKIKNKDYDYTFSFSPQS